MAKKRITATDLRNLKQGEEARGGGLTVLRISTTEYKFTTDQVHEGKRHRKTLGTTPEGWTLSKAYGELDNWKAQLDEGLDNTPMRRGKHPKWFDQAADEYLERLKTSNGKDIRSKTYRLATLKQFFDQTPLRSITASRGDEYTHWRRENGAKDATIKNELNALGHLFTMALEWGWVTTRPKFRKPNPDNRRTTFFTKEQASTVLGQAGLYPDPQAYTFCLILFRTGMRVQEILGLRIGDIQFDRGDLGQLFIIKGKTGSRYVPMSLQLRQHLKEVIAKRGTVSANDWLFPNPNSASGRRENFRKGWATIIKAAGLDPKVYVRHTGRHSATTWLFHDGLDMASVSSVTGHKSPSILMRYAHESEQLRQQAVNRLDDNS